MSIINFFVEFTPWLKEFVFDQILTEIINVQIMLKRNASSATAELLFHF
ncbi:hypothetical protein HMPREF1547_00117 [Blautia sp. KLE 1732]|nr:hypothetical protein HMPREF1547_00117 [Blautia sp. KLE 1732]